jgi:CrcB protein
VGGALGASARYGIAQLVDISPGTFPWGTFWINVSGSFLLGVFLTVVLERVSPTRYLRPFVATGFIGAYTTYSTFAVETDLLVRNGHWPVALTYAVASLATGFPAVWGGILLARTVPWIRRDRHAS